MKDRSFTSNFISEGTVNSLIAVSNARTATFSDLVKIAGLDKRRDFRCSDLRDLDLSYSDLRGFDFSNADLTGATGINVTWDSTTELKGASLTESIFASKGRLNEFFAHDQKANAIFQRVSREDWAGQILWAGNNLLKSGPYRDIALRVTEALMYNASDRFVKSELLSYFLSRLDSVDTAKEVLLGILSDPFIPSSSLKNCFKAIRRLKLTQDKAIRNSLDQIQGYSAANEAMGFLVGTSTNSSELTYLRERIADRGYDGKGNVYVAQIARRLGEVYDLITRDPVTNGTFSMKTYVTPHTRDLIARRWARVDDRFRTKRLADIKPGFTEVKDTEVVERAQKIEAMWKELQRYGIEIVVDPRVRIHHLVTAK